MSKNVHVMERETNDNSTWHHDYAWNHLFRCVQTSNVYYYMERSFAEVSKSLATYRSENNFVLTIKIIM